MNINNFKNILTGAGCLMSMLTVGNVANAQPTQQKKVDNNGEKKMNVLLIISDDLNCDLGSYDDPIVKTPNLDRLRQHAVRFNNTYCQFPLSGPSRASMLTGYSPEKTKVMNLENDFREALPNCVTLPQLFKNNGYYTARVGKVFHAGVPFDIGHDGLDDAKSWTEKYNPIGRDKTDEKKVQVLTSKLTFGGRIGGALAYMQTNGTDDELTDAIGANIACKLINDHKNKPFFIAMGFYRPHTPYVATKKYFDMYPWQQMELPYVPANDWGNRPAAARRSAKNGYGLPDDSLKVAKAAYYAAISFMDAQVGKLLDELDRNNLTNNTVIVFCGDNGYNLGQHGQWQKQMLFEHSARVPMIISVPGITNSKESFDRPVELLDLYPTLVNVCGAKNAPTDLDGRDITPLLKNISTPWEAYAYSQQNRMPSKHGASAVKEPTMGRSIRSDRYRLTEWNDGAAGGELYDYQNDPEEHVNLWNNKKYKKVQAELSKRLHDHYEKMMK